MENSFKKDPLESEMVITKSEFKALTGEDAEDMFGGMMEDYGIEDDDEIEFSVCHNCQSIDVCLSAEYCPKHGRQ